MRPLHVVIPLTYTSRHWGAVTVWALFLFPKNPCSFSQSPELCSKFLGALFDFRHKIEDLRFYQKTFTESEILNILPKSLIPGNG